MKNLDEMAAFAAALNERVLMLEASLAGVYTLVEDYEERHNTGCDEDGGDVSVYLYEAVEDIKAALGAGKKNYLSLIAGTNAEQLKLERINMLAHELVNSDDWEGAGNAHVNSAAEYIGKQIQKILGT